MLNHDDAFSIWKAIRRNHPFFQEGGAFGFDWRTFHATDPHACAVLREAISIATGTKLDLVSHYSPQA